MLATVQDEAAKIDRIAQIRGWFRPKDGSTQYSIIQKLLAEEVGADDAASQLFGPIDEKVSTSSREAIQGSSYRMLPEWHLV